MKSSGRVARAAARHVWLCHLGRAQKQLLLARDRVGIKPLYYRLTDDSLIFASEIKAILADPTAKREIAPEMIDRFLTFMYLPGEETLLKGIQKLAPGHYLQLVNNKPVIRQYWDLTFPTSYRKRASRKRKGSSFVSFRKP